MKRIIASLLVLLLLMGAAACTNEKPEETTNAPAAQIVTDAEIPEFSVLVNGVEVTNETMADYTVYSVQTHSVNSHGTEDNRLYVGYAVSDVLAAAGIEGEYTEVKAAADDGYEIAYDADTAKLSTTLLAVIRDGEPFKKGPWFAPCHSGTSGDYLKNVASIGVDAEAVLPEDTEEDTEETGLPEIQDRTDKVTFGDYRFLVNGNEVTNDTLAGLSIYKITVNVVNSKGVESEATYTGYRLSDVLAACGVTEFTSVTAVADDGYESDIDSDTAKSEYTLLAIEKDKETGEGGTVWVAPCMETTSGEYVKLVVEIKAD